MAVRNKEMDVFLTPFNPLTCGEGKYQPVFRHVHHPSEGKIHPVLPCI